jgi:hypothetical protein
MVWQRNDDQYGVSRKITRIPVTALGVPIKLAAVGLDQLAKNYSCREMTGGILDAVELDSVLATPVLVDELVRVELWHRTGHDCEECVQPPPRGIVIHDFYSCIEPPPRKRPWIPDSVRRAVYERDGYTCVLCGSKESLSLDHIMRYRHGGPDTFENLRTLCLPCNVERG